MRRAADVATREQFHAKVDAVKLALADRILPLAREVAPNGRIVGRGARQEWEGKDASGAKWGIVLAGDKRGVWQNFATGQAGRSGLSLIRDAFCGGDFQAAFTRALAWLGEELPQPRAAPQPTSEPLPTPSGERNEKALALFLHGERFTWDGPVGLYLRGRGIAPEPFGGRPFGALRFHPTCWCEEAGKRLPAMLAAVIDPQGKKHIATHRTWLAQRGQDWIKAPLEKPKKAWGPFGGGLIALTQGEAGRPLSRAQDGERALLAEGIENTLTVAQWHARHRALAYVAASNLALLDLPEQLGRVMLVLDRDGENDAINRTRQETVAHWEAEGRHVRLWVPPPGHKDANAYWLREIERANDDAA
jgi:hypothetical protein